MTTLEKKIQKKVDEINNLISLASNSESDNAYDGNLMVTDTSSTWEEPAIYKPIVFRNGVLYIEYFEPYSNRTKKDKILKRNLEFDGYGTLLDIAKIYRRALKKENIKYANGGDFQSGVYAKGGGVKINTEVILSENRPNGAEWQGVVKPFMLKSIEENQYAGGFKRYEIDIYDEVDREPTKEEIKKANEFFDKIGGRYAGGGKIKPFEYKENNSTIMFNGTKSDVKEMYLDYKNNFLSVRKFAEHYNISETQANSIINQGRKYAKEDGYYADGGGIEYAIKGYKEYTKKNWEGYDYFSEKYAVNELAELELDLRKLNDGKLAPRKVVGTGYKNAKKVAQDWLQSQINKQKLAIKTNGLSDYTNHRNFRSYLVDAKRQNIISEIKFNQLLDESNEIMDSLPESFAGGGEFMTDPTFGNFQNNIYADGGVTENYVSRKKLNTITIKKGNQKLTYKISDVLNGAYKLESGAKLEDIAFYVPKRSIVKVQLKTGKDFKPANGYWIKDGAKPIHVTKFDDGGSINNLSREEFMKKEIDSQKQKEKSITFKKYKVNVYEEGYPFVEPLMTDNFIEAINFAKKTIESQKRYRNTSKDLFAEIDKFQPIEQRGNVRYPYYSFASFSEEDLKTTKFDEGGKVTSFTNKDGIRVRSKVEPKEKMSEKEWMAKHNSSKEARSYMGGGKTETPTKKGKGNHKMKATTDLARKIRKEGEKWTDAIKRASLQLK